MGYCKKCGKWSGYYQLCKNCYNDEQDNDNDESLDENEQDIQETEFPEYINDSGICCVCGANAPNGKQCKNCYYETQDYRDNIDKNRKSTELREWYFNLKNSIYRQYDLNKKQSNCNKLIALAILCRDLHGDDDLISRVYKDIENLLNKSKNISINQQIEIKEYDMSKNDTSGQVKCIDGHWVENDLEKDIDDMLYQLRRPHVYAKRVNEITSRGVKSDWFIPILSDTKGIYIELWGMDTEDYKRNKEEKIKLYKEEELALIEIYRKDVMADKTQTRDNLESEINKLEKELKKRK